MGAERAEIFPSKPDRSTILKDSEKKQKDVNTETSNALYEKYKDVSIEVNPEDFKPLVDYIEKNGFVVPQDGVPCDRQYTFFDSHRNRHAMITIKRDSDGNPSMKGKIDQISVWAYKDGIKDQKHFFGYIIKKGKIVSILGDGGDEKNVRFGYDEFLKKVKGSN